MRGLGNVHRVETLIYHCFCEGTQKTPITVCEITVCKVKHQRTFRGLGENLESHVSCLVLQKWTDLYAIDSLIQ